MTDNITSLPPHAAGEEDTIGRDPHHGGENSWKWENGKLYHHSVGATQWVEVKRVSVTPARITMLAGLLSPAASQPTPKAGEEERYDIVLVKCLVSAARRWARIYQSPTPKNSLAYLTACTGVCDMVHEFDKRYPPERGDATKLVRSESPAASQAAPETEMPEWMQRNLAIMRAESNRDSTEDMAIWLDNDRQRLADRVVELERERAIWQGYAETADEINAQLTQQLSSLQASAAQDIPSPPVVEEMPDWVLIHKSYWDALLSSNPALQSPDNHSLAAALAWALNALQSSRERAEEYKALRELVDSQAEDEGLWFLAQSASEAYLQQNLRRLHSAVEIITHQSNA